MRHVDENIGGRHDQKNDSWRTKTWVVGGGIVNDGGLFRGWVFPCHNRNHHDDPHSWCVVTQRLYSVSYLQNNKIRRAIILFHSVPTTQKIRIIIQYNEDYQQYLLRNIELD